MTTMINRNNTNNDEFNEYPGNGFGLGLSANPESESGVDYDEWDDEIEMLKSGRMHTYSLCQATINKKQFEQLCFALNEGCESLTSFSFSYSLIQFSQEFDEDEDALAERILTILTTCHNLTSLDLSYTSISNENSHLVAEIIRNNSNLCSLNLSHCAIYNQALITLGDVFGEERVIEFNQLEEILLSANNFSLTGFHHFMSGLKNITSLKKLDISANNIDDEMANEILELITDTNLYAIELNNNQITSIGIKNICNAITISTIKNLGSIRPFSLSLNQNPIGNAGLLALTKFLENNGPLADLSILIPPNHAIEGRKVAKLIAATNKNSYLKCLTCLNAPRKWDQAILVGVFDELKSNCTLVSINLGEWKEDLVIDMLKYNFTLQHIYNYTDNTQDFYSVAADRVNLSLSMNILLDQILSKNIFANIDVINQIIFIMKAKQCLTKNDITKPLAALLGVIVSSAGILNPVILNLEAKDRTTVLNVIAGTLAKVGTPLYKSTLNGVLVKTIDYLLQELNKNNKDISANHFSLYYRTNPKILIKSCLTEANKLEGTLSQNTQQPVIIPTIALQLPSLKDLCYHVVALQIMKEQSYVTLNAKKQQIPADLACDLDRVTSLLPGLSVCTRQGYFFSEWILKKKSGVQLVPAIADESFEDIQQAEHENNKELLPVTHRLRLTNSKI